MTVASTSTLTATALAFSLVGSVPMVRRLRDRLRRRNRPPDDVGLEPGEVIDLLEQLADGLLAFDVSGRISWANARAAAFLGQAGPADLVGTFPWPYLHPSSRRQAVRAARRVVAGASVEPLVLQMDTGDDERFVEVTLSMTAGRTGTIRMLGSVRDVTDRVMTERALAHRAEQIAVAFYDAPHGMTLTTVDGILHRVNQAAADFVGYTIDELVGRNVFDLLHADDLALIKEEAPPFLLGARRSGPHTRRYVRKDGTIAHGQLSLSAVVVGGTPMVLGQVVDISEQQAAFDQLAQAAVRDPLTGLANRRRILEELDTILSTPGRRATVLFCDIDRFKAVNDTLGHAAGDEVLTRIAARLLEAVRPEDLVGRLGGDEFTIVIGDATDISVLSIAGRLHDALSTPVVIRGEDVYVTSSIGIATATAGAASAGDLLRDADLAMYRAKENGRARIEWFDAETRVRVRSQHRTVTELRQALERDSLEVHYQPIVSLADRQMRGVEALVRLSSDPSERTSATELVQAAEESGLIMELGRSVMAKAFGDVTGWQRRFGAELEGFSLAVNLSARQLTNSRLVSEIKEMIASSGIGADSVWLELTESALTNDVPAAQAALFALDRLGTRLSVDDFGTGYVSLTYLARFPVRRLKIDRSFVAELGTAHGADAIVTALIGLADALDIDVVAEGIENEDQLHRLLQLGCRYGQGYLFGRPVPARQLDQRLAEHVASRRTLGP